MGQKKTRERFLTSLRRRRRKGRKRNKKLYAFGVGRYIQTWKLEKKTITISMNKTTTAKRKRKEREVKRRRKGYAWLNTFEAYKIE